MISMPTTLQQLTRKNAWGILVDLCTDAEVALGISDNSLITNAIHFKHSVIFFYRYRLSGYLDPECFKGLFHSAGAFPLRDWLQFKENKELANKWISDVICDSDSLPDLIEEALNPRIGAIISDRCVVPANNPYTRKKVDMMPLSIIRLCDRDKLQALIKGNEPDYSHDYTDGGMSYD